MAGAHYRLWMHPYFSVALPHLFGHRGAAGEAPENTLPSFERACAAGLRYLETDCHATHDGEIVLCHDPELERITNGQGPISAHSYAELEKLDAGYHFSADGRTHPFRGCGVRILRLVEMLEAFPTAHVNLEVKQADAAVAAEVVRLVRRTGAERRLLLAAENGQVLDLLRALEPGTALGSSREDVIAFFGALDAGASADFAPLGHALQIPPSVYGRDLVTREALAYARRLGLFVHVWTINDPAEMRRLLALGVHGLMSDHPARLLETARAHAGA
jgi:glycerophosphoryl diester phosphodiesterase